MNQAHELFGHGFESGEELRGLLQLAARSALLQFGG